jgi:hypothetical protein
MQSYDTVAASIGPRLTEFGGVVRVVIERNDGAGPTWKVSDRDDATVDRGDLLGSADIEQAVGKARAVAEG